MAARLLKRPGSPQCSPGAAQPKAGVALGLLPHEVSRERVRDAAERLLSEPSYRANAERVQAELHAMPSPHDVAALIEQVATI
jgi:UDP:flavonoid glycosyltransferase YjiC (YdhE family)